jgi:phage-related minor tail protein
VADRTVRAIFEARVSGAQKGMRDFAKDVDGAGKKVDGLTKDLKTLGNAKVTPTIDVKIADAKKRLSELTRDLADLKAQPSSLAVDFKIEQAKAAIKEVRGEIKDLNGERAEVRVEASIKDAQKRISDLTVELGALRTMDVSPVVTADIRESQKKLREARAELRELNGAKAEMKVTADTSPAKREIAGLGDDVAAEGSEAGEEAGGNIATGILDALRTIPIAGAVIGVGVAIAGGILLGIKQGLQIEAERDLFSAQTGLDEDTSARFGRAAGEAYANAWGDSVAANLDTATMALRAGIIDSEATDAEIENVIAKLQGINDLFDYDIAESVRGVGNLMKSGLVKDADQAFDLIVKASQKVQSDDLIDTLNEYSTQFKTLGLDGPKAFGLIVQAAEAGARDTDNVADSLKEMGLRIREGTEPAVDALKMLGLDAKDTISAFQEGGPRAVTAIDRVFDALRDLEEKGGNTQAVIAALFGGPGEDLGAALYALDVDKVAEALGGVEGAAGAADRALQTMSDNTSTKIEQAKRNVEIAMDGIKGALAEAFGDDIGGAADWISKNRAPMIEFFQMVMNGAFEMGKSFIDFSATALEALASFAEQAADILVYLPGFSLGDRDDMKNVAADMRKSAGEMREDFTGALDDMQDRANQWVAPEILKARIHDATMKMTEDMDAFSAKVEATGGTVTINGDKVNSEEALKLLIENIDAETGTVTINGDKVPAEDALDEVMRSIDLAEEDVTIGADPQRAKERLRVLKGQISATEASMSVDADTSAARSALEDLRRRYATMNIRVAGVTGQGGLTAGTHAGGWTGRMPGLHAGGRVPGSDPGYDNILWPLNSGGRTLQQPLAGGEYVVNSKDSAYWGPILEWMNSGGRPTAQTVTNDSSLKADVVNIVTPSPSAFKREIRTAPYRAKARPGR